MTTKNAKRISLEYRIECLQKLLQDPTLTERSFNKFYDRLQAARAELAQIA